MREVSSDEWGLTRGSRAVPGIDNRRSLLASLTSGPRAIQSMTEGLAEQGDVSRQEEKEGSG